MAIKRLFVCWVAMVGLVMSGCASIDFDYPREESTALVNTTDTYLGTKVALLSADKPESGSGFYPLSDGIDALSVRLLLAERAERTIDVQYYLIKTDTTSLAFIRALLRAADRGVKALVARGFLERRTDEGDRRRHTLHITRPRGQAILEDIIPRARQFERQLLEALTREENVLLQSILEKLQESAEDALGDSKR